MKLRTISALSSAAALVFSLAAAVPASAETASVELESVKQPTTLSASKVASVPSGKVAAAAAAIPTVRAISVSRAANRNRITDSKYVYGSANIAWTLPPGTYATSVKGHLYIGGKYRGKIDLPGSPWNNWIFSWPKSWGAGAAQIRKVEYSYYDASYNRINRVQTIASNAFNVRRTLNYRVGGRIEKRGSKVSVSLKHWTYYQPKGKNKSAKKAILQRKVGKKWRKVKTIKLNKKGHGKTSFRSGKKYHYRVYIKTTANREGIKARPIPRKKI